MKYENPYMSVVLLDDEDVIRTSVGSGTLLPEIDGGDQGGTTIPGDD